MIENWFMRLFSLQKKRISFQLFNSSVLIIFRGLWTHENSRGRKS